jgi:hypothetical protein
MKYGDLTIIHNKKTKQYFSGLMSLLFTTSQPSKSTYIFLFEDGEVFDLEINLIDFKYRFFNGVLTAPLPTYFEKKEGDPNRTIFFLKKQTVSEDFSQLFSQYTKYNVLANAQSEYNCIYYCHISGYSKPETFGLTRIKSNDSMPRFQFAYDSEQFTKEEIIYITHYFFENRPLNIS